jgi:succinate dehydrogenase / fumarate reductase flavoprotein subunit
MAVKNSYPITDHSFDVVVVGAGGAGLRATLGASRRIEDGLHLESFPTRRMVAAQAALRRRFPTWGPMTGAGTCTTR